MFHAYLKSLKWVESAKYNLFMPSLLADTNTDLMHWYSCYELFRITVKELRRNSSLSTPRLAGREKRGSEGEVKRATPNLSILSLSPTRRKFSIPLLTFFACFPRLFSEATEMFIEDLN